MTAVGVLFLLAGAVLLARSGQVLTRANAGVALPAWWGRPTVLPRAVYTWRFGGLFCVIFGANLVASDRTTWWAGVPLILAAWAPAFLIHARHNRRVRAAGH
ncbi:hypothetical protein [Georgenia thermotolerans]|uniref:Uncharacterized protein n=1 Tax=Georgenia thermotolerans TaxID=527326 RepID=A0A7J5UNI5_9MICO|nr:hypothetical protein [Georgenia thermotolerans]KAE8763929.1 hypothetical protein GB883_11510 [Georgenia thermotolerans]